MPLEIGFIKEMRTIGGNKEIPKTLLHYKIPLTRDSN